MASGTNVTPNFLWALRIKINTPDGGLNTKFWMPNKTEAVAMLAALDITNRMKQLMPSTCEIFAATISKSNTKKDSRIVLGAQGDGNYLQTADPVVATTYNRYDDCINVRFENEDGGGVTMKLGPIPDTIIEAQTIKLPITAVEDMTAVPAAAVVGGATYAAEFTKLMLTIGKACGQITSKTNVPGGTYEYFAFTRAIVEGVGKKKGGRIFRR